MKHQLINSMVMALRLMARRDDECLVTDEVNALVSVRADVIVLLDGLFDQSPKNGARLRRWDSRYNRAGGWPMLSIVSLGKVIVNPHGTAIQLGVTTLNGAIAAGDTQLTVNSINGVPVAVGHRFQIDSEIMRATLLGGDGNKTWTVIRGTEGTTPAAHNNSAVVTFLTEVATLFVSEVTGQTGKCYLGTAQLAQASGAGVIKEMWPTGAGGGIDDTYQLPMIKGKKYRLSDFWIDTSVDSEGMFISGVVDPD